MKMLMKAGLLAMFIAGAFALPTQDAEAATRCYWRNGQRVCYHVDNRNHRHGYQRHGYRYRTECYRNRYGTRVCRRVAY